MQPQKIVSTIKSELKKQGLTYAELADALGMSTAGIKRMFSIGDFSLKRLGQVCQVLNLDERDFFRSLITEERLTRLTLEQETALAADETMLLVFYYLLTGMEPKKIEAVLRTDHGTIFKALHQLDRMGLIELQKGDKVKALMTRAPEWSPDGPLTKRFGVALLKEFYATSFEGEYEQYEFQTGTLSEESFRIISRKLKQLNEEFLSLAELDRQLDPARTQTYWTTSAIRPWAPLGVIARGQNEPS